MLHSCGTKERPCRNNSWPSRSPTASPETTPHEPRGRLKSFADQTASFTLVPGAGGAFEVEVDGDLVYSKKSEGRYPEIKELEEAISGRLS